MLRRAIGLLLRRCPILLLGSLVATLSIRLLAAVCRIEGQRRRFGDQRKEFHGDAAGELTLLLLRWLLAILLLLLRSSWRTAIGRLLTLRRTVLLSRSDDVSERADEEIDFDGGEGERIVDDTAAPARGPVNQWT